MKTNANEVNVKLVDFLNASAALLLALAVTVQSEMDEKPEETEDDDLLGPAKPEGVDDLLGDTPAPAEVKPAKPAKPAKAKPAEPVAPPPPPPPVVNPEQQLADLRAAAVGYAQKHGREKLVALVKEYTKGTLPDIPADKRAEVIAKLKAV